MSRPYLSKINMAEEGPRNQSLEPFTVAVNTSPNASCQNPTKLPDIHDAQNSHNVSDDKEDSSSSDGGIHERKLKDLSNGEAEFPGVKREKWWSVIMIGYSYV